MSDKILQSIFAFTKKYTDPQNKSPFNQENPNIQVVEKNGSVNISLSVSYTSRTQRLNEKNGTGTKVYNLRKNPNVTNY